jgi:hypothetical protein
MRRSVRASLTMKILGGMCSDCDGASSDPLKGAVPRCKREMTYTPEVAS